MCARVRSYVCIYDVCMSTRNIIHVHACLIIKYDLPKEAHFDGRSFYFQNKRESDPPARKRLRIDELKKGDSWRTGMCAESQVSQVFFYLLAVQLRALHKKQYLRPLLGLHVEGDEVHTIDIHVFHDGLTIIFVATDADSHSYCH